MDSESQIVNHTHIYVLKLNYRRKISSYNLKIQVQIETIVRYKMPLV